MVFMVWRWIQLGNDTEKIVLEWWIFIYKCLMLQGTIRRKKEMGDGEKFLSSSSLGVNWKQNKLDREYFKEWLSSKSRANCTLKC